MNEKVELGGWPCGDYPALQKEAITFVLTPAGLRVLEPNDDLLTLRSDESRVRRLSWPDGAYCVVLGNTVQCCYQDQVTTQVVTDRNNVRVYPDGTFDLLPYELPNKGESRVVTDSFVVLGVTLSHSWPAGVFRPGDVSNNG